MRVKTALAGVPLFALILLAIGLGDSRNQTVLAQAATQGQWRTLTNQVPINPVHVAVLRTGQILIVAGSGNVATETNFQAALWYPASETFQTQTVAWDMFCNGMVVLHDGRVFVNGGNLKYDPFWGEPRNAVYDPTTGIFSNVQNMARGRWYPTVTTLGDGRVMTFSGLLDTGGTNTSVEIYSVGSGWSQQYTAGWTPPLYPRMHLSTDGRVFYAGSTRSSRFFSPSTNTWSGIVATTNYSGNRTYGTSVLLPLTPANGYRPRVMIFGGGNPATATTEIIDLTPATPQWQFGPSMSQPRIQMNATILPNGKVLASGGSRNDEDALTAGLNADLYDPIANTFAPAGANVFPRLYHSNALLLPDATVLLIGGNPQRGSYERRLEIYSPSYLFNADGTYAVRPTISGVSADPLGYGAPFAVQTPDAAQIASVVLVRPGAATHAFDMEQRLVGLSYTVGNGVLNVTSPPDGNIAPPGYYMLFVLNTDGVPSVARFIRLMPVAANTAPTVSDIGDQTTPEDGTVTGVAFTVGDAETTAGSLTISGSSSNQTLVPNGNVVFGGSGANRTVTVTPAANQSGTTTIAVTVSDGTLTASDTFVVTVTPVNDVPTIANITDQTVEQNTSTGALAFTVGDVETAAGSLTVSGSSSNQTLVPNGNVVFGGSGANRTVTVTPAANQSGTTTITVTVSDGTLTASDTFVVTVVNGDFAISATPASQSIARGDSATYNVLITFTSGFSGPVNLTVSGLLGRTGATFSPASVASSGTSTLTVVAERNAQKGTRTLTIIGAGGGRVHSATVSLTIR